MYPSVHLQRVPINIVHGEIADFLKRRADKHIKFYSSFQVYGLVHYWRKNKENPVIQTRDIFDLVGQCIFRPAQCNSTHTKILLLGMRYTYRSVLEILHVPYGAFGYGCSHLDMLGTIIKSYST